METLLETIGQLITRLGNLSVEQLLLVCQRLEMEVGDAASKTNGRLRLARKVINYLNSDDVQDRDDGGQEIVEMLQNFVDEIAPSEPSTAAPTASSSKQSTKEPTEVETTTPEEKPPSLPQKPVANVDVMNMIRREFKISGQIGEPGQKDRLTFASLANQIETGRQKGYSDGDIVHAVIRAIVPGSELRSYLEGRSKIPLPDLRRIIRSHYQERDATELFKQLSQLTQEAKETPQAFLLRAFNIRQKVIFASQEVESKLRYEPQLVREMFRHTLVTGLRSESIKNELRPYLDDSETTDEVLFEKMNRFASIEAERRKKLDHTRPVAISEVQESRKQTPPPKQGLLMTEIAELKAGIAELSSLKSQVTALQESLQMSPQRKFQTGRGQPSRRRGCLRCREEERGDTCDHCFKCGSPDHFARGCRSKKDANQGNEGRLLPGDRE